MLSTNRWKHGIAASLAYVSLDNDTSLVYPYPSWEANTLPVNKSIGKKGFSLKSKSNLIIHFLHRRSADKNSEEEMGRIISTFRIRIDECDRLWVMDTGLADILGSPHQFKPSSIVIYDLTTDKLIRRFTIPEDSVKDDSFFANIVSQGLLDLF